MPKGIRGFRVGHEVSIVTKTKIGNKNRRQTHRSRKGIKLSVVRDTQSRFADIVAYKKAHEKGKKKRREVKEK